MEFAHCSTKNKVRSRSGSGVRLEYYQRLVHKTILKYQVHMPWMHYIYIV